VKREKGQGKRDKRQGKRTRDKGKARREKEKGKRGKRTTLFFLPSPSPFSLFPFTYVPAL
jgi:hypothetical protein